LSISSHLDTLEQNILQELDDTEDKIKSRIDKLLQQLSKNSKSVEGLQSDIIAVKEYASDLQALLGTKVIEGSWNICRCCRISKRFSCLFFVILSILFLISVKFCSMLSINVDDFDVLIISRIDKSPTQSLWFVEIQSGQQVCHGVDKNVYISYHDIHNAQYITKYADQWCLECYDGLCSDCENHHKISKSSRNHGVISIENYHKLPSSISEIGNHCEYHDMKYTHFCQHHWSAYFVIYWASHIPHSIWFDVAISTYKNVKNNISYRF
jgi:hypothetical protein